MTEMYSFVVLEVRSLKSMCEQEVLCLFSSWELSPVYVSLWLHVTLLILAFLFLCVWNRPLPQSYKDTYHRI
jgi:hypothetical protein